MRKLVVILLILLAAGQPSAAKTSESTQVNRAKRTIERAERYLDTIEKQLNSETPMAATMVDRWNDKADKAEQFLAKAEDMLKEVSASAGAAERQSLQSTRQRLSGVRNRIAQKQQKAESAVSVATGAQGQQGIEDYRKLSEKFRQVSQWLRSPDDSKLERNPFQQAMEARQALNEKYAGVLSVRSRETFELQAAASEAKMSEQSLQSTVKWAQQHFPELIDKDLQQAHDHSKELVKRGAFGGWDSSVQRYLNYAKLRYEKLATVAPGDQGLSAVKARVDTAEQSLNATKEKFRRQLIAGNTMPADAYGGSDAAAIKAAVKKLWAQKYPQDRVARVVIADSNWSDFSGTRWVSSSRSWNTYNYDRLNAYVLVPGGSYNYKFFAQVVRQNLQGGRIDIFPDRPENPEQHVHTLLPK